MCAIKKPIPKLKDNKINKPRPFASKEEKATNKIPSEQAVQLEQKDEAVAQEQQFEPLEQQNEAVKLEQKDEAVAQEQQPEPLEPQNEAVLPQQQSELTTDEKVEILREIAGQKNWLKKLKPIVPKQINSFSEEDGVVTVVNDRNSKRIKLKGKALKGLNNPDYIKFYVTDNEFVVQASTADEEGSYKLKLEGKRKCLIYNTEVIELLVEMFELDFSKGTSQTFGEVTFKNIDGIEYAVIS